MAAIDRLIGISGNKESAGHSTQLHKQTQHTRIKILCLSKLDEGEERERVRSLLVALKAEPERQVTYHAAEVYAQSGLDPRQIDPLLVKLAAQELLLYRAYSRGITFTVNESINNPRSLAVIESRFGHRYQRFEERLQHMIDYLDLKQNQNRCRSVELIYYLTGEADMSTCGKCDLCSPTSIGLPWEPDIRLYGERLEVDVRLTVLGTAFGRIEGQMRPLLSASARSSDHFEELKDRKISPDHLRLTVDALIEGGYLQLIEKSWRGNDEEQKTYQAVTITQKGRDALAGGVNLPHASGKSEGVA